MTNLILVIVLLVLLGGAVVYIVRAKRRGIKCVGCPEGGECACRRECTGDCYGKNTGCSRE